MKQIFFFLITTMLVISACGGGEKITPNGYTLINHTNNSGEKPQIGDYGYVYVYVFQDDSLVNSSREYGRAIPVAVPDFATMPEDQKGPGKSNPIADAIGMMAVGDSVSVIIPIDEKMREMPQLKDAKKLVYDIVLAEIKTAQAYQEAQAAERAAANEKTALIQAREPEIATLMTDMAKKYKAGELTSQIKSTASGLKYLIIEEGSGAQAEPQKKVEVLYYGTLTDGKMFDNSFMRGSAFPFTLGVGQVIPGWDEGIALLKEGSKAVLFIPSELAYGATGSGDAIPPNSELLFYVELQKVGQ
jgi:FKBP-type peptidyl-prolyl cis-trans isomerase FkpA